MKNTFSKITAVMLSLMLVCLMTFTAGAAELQGEGTMDSPYIISSADELDLLSQLVADGESFFGKYFLLTDSVTANADFTPIGTADVPFSGIFDGNGKTLSGFNTECDNAAVFAFAESAVIKNLTVSGSFFAESYAGAVTAYAENTIIENCTGSAIVYADSFAGGIAGYIGSGRINNCTTTSSAMTGGHEEYCGGIAGKSGAIISNCTNNAYTYGTKNVGGIAGEASAEIASCTNTATVSASGENLGGIAGITTGSITLSKNTGSVSAYFGAPISKAGGIAGVGYEAEITACHNAGTVSATENFAGGIAGYLTGGKVINCLSTTSVSAGADFAGGIFGYALKTQVSDCVFSAAASAGNDKAAAIGALAQCTTTDCYYNSDKNTTAIFTGTATGSIGVTTDAFTSEDSFTNLDFENVWVINTYHASYPLLKDISYHTVKILSNTPADCTSDGVINGICTVCQEEIETRTPALGHSVIVVSSKLPSCTVSGYKDTLCTVCGEGDSEILTAPGHQDADGNSTCDVCSATLKGEDSQQGEKNIFEKIADFFRSILDWIRSLFA